MNDLQKCLLHMLEDLKDLCEKEDIEFFLVEGNALGAIRHEGFIPWDDDLDIGMTRENYNKFKSRFFEDKEFQKKYFYQDCETDSNYFIPFPKLRKNDSLYIEKGTQNLDIHQGIYIDIFVLDYLSDKSIIRQLQYLACQLIEAIIRKNKPKNFIKRFIIWFIFKVNIKEKALNLFKYIMQNFGKNTNNYYSYFMCGSIYGLKGDMLYPLRKIKYENIECFVFNKVESYLEVRYGDYLKLPSLEERSNNQHHIYYEIELQEDKTYEYSE